MEHKFPQIKPHPFSKVFRPRTDQSAITLISLLLEYTPTARLSAPQALVNEFFDELRVEGVKLPNGHDMPALFNFTKEGELISLFTCDEDGEGGREVEGDLKANEGEGGEEEKRERKNRADCQNYQPDPTLSESLYPHTPSPHSERMVLSWKDSSLSQRSKCASPSIKPLNRYYVHSPLSYPPNHHSSSLHYTISNILGK